MAKQITITIADKVLFEINQNMVIYGYTNKSEYVEELIRLGLKQEKVCANGENNKLQ